MPLMFVLVKHDEARFVDIPLYRNEGSVVWYEKELVISM